MHVRESCGDTERIVGEIYPALRRFAAVVAPLESEPDDLVQEALAATLARSGLGELDDPLAYLRVVILRLASNERRRLGRKRRALQRSENPATATDALYPSDVAVLVNVSAEDRALLWLTVVEGRSIAEVAAFFDRPVSALKMRRHRALRKLRRLIEEEHDE